MYTINLNKQPQQIEKYITINLYDRSESTVEYDKLPTIRKELASKGITDMMFAPGDYKDSFIGMLYAECDDMKALDFAIRFNSYRSIEARDAIIDRLVKKFNYVTKKTENYLYVIDPVEKKKMDKSLQIKDNFIKDLNAGKEIRVRINQEICDFSTEPTKYYTTYQVTASNYRGLQIAANFSLEKFNFKKYKNYDFYYHILDENGNVLKTRGHYCYITGTVIAEKHNGYDDYQRVDIIVNSIRLE